MFEHRLAPLLPWPAFRRRLLWTTALGLGLIAISLAVGMVGYKLTAPREMSWTDSFLNAAMILSGMGPVEQFENCDCKGAKIFAGFYALYSGLALISIAGLMFSPIFHRFLHKFHLEQEGKSGK
ncbi:MAG TPA: hypothetical protein VKH43_01675 [Thermoanaerobaculia bacterium]|nr:hypothetical protein [Thermoanaerobaculia bacterium]